MLTLSLNKPLNKSGTDLLFHFFTLKLKPLDKSMLLKPNFLICILCLDKQKNSA